MTIMTYDALFGVSLLRSQSSAYKLYVSTVGCKIRMDASHLLNDKYIHFLLHVHHLPYISLYSQGLSRFTTFTRVHYHVGNTINGLFIPATTSKLITVSA
jgi:hypothetical protein